MGSRCCDHCGKVVDITKESEVPAFYSVWKRLPHNKIAVITVCEDCEPLFERHSWYCATCGKDSGNTIYTALRTLPTGEQEGIFVCQECRPLFGDIKRLNTILGGPTYTNENRPPAWRNPVPLDYQGYHPSYRELNVVRRDGPEYYAHVVKGIAIDTTRFPHDDFPLIEDFEIVLLTGRMAHRPEEKEPYYLIHAFSPSLGFLALLDYSFHVPQDLCQPDFIIPHGDFAIPYTDLEQGWNILIAENESFVYILTGDGVEGLGSYDGWFKVEKSRYYSQWEKAVQLCRSVCREVGAL